MIALVLKFLQAERHMVSPCLLCLLTLHRHTVRRAGGLKNSANNVFSAFMFPEFRLNE